MCMFRRGENPSYLHWAIDLMPPEQFAATYRPRAVALLEIHAGDEKITAAMQALLDDD